MRVSTMSQEGRVPSLIHLHDDVLAGDQDPSALRDLHDDVLAGDQDLLASVVGAREDGTPLREICDTIRKICSMKKCQDHVYERVMSEGMGIKVARPDNVDLNKWLNLWCKVVYYPEDYFGSDKLWSKPPVNIDPVESLKWADEHGLLPTMQQQTRSFWSGVLVDAADEYDIRVMVYLFDTFKVSMVSMVVGIALAVRNAGVAANDVVTSLMELLRGRDWLHPEPVLKLLEAYDRREAALDSQDSLHKLFKNPKYRTMLVNLATFADSSLKKGHADAQKIMDWAASKHLFIYGPDASFP